MTLQQLNYIIALDEYRHFVKAAESCFVAQPTLTLQVKKLENEIGLVLFDRDSHPLKPTKMGEKFIEKARKIIKLSEELKNFVNNDKEQMEGTFRIGVIPTLAQYLLPLFLDKFIKKYPKTNLVIKEWQSDDIIKGLDQGKLDLGILATPLNEDNLTEIPVFYEPFLLFADEDNPLLNQNIIVGELPDEGLWLLENGHCFRNQTQSICSKNPKQNSINFEGGSIETLKKMINKLGGYTLIPELAYSDSDKSNIKRFSTPEPTREISIITEKSFTKEKLIREIKRSILESIPDSFNKNEKLNVVKWR